MNKFVPYLADEEIERDAAALLAEYAQKLGLLLREIPHQQILVGGA